ncbi:uncharacterized protein LOC109723952 isoform X2 [Ananas comosus]|uniref:Uncharacterized protein LOC109723952 isoform X2 n=1 Tax=Ananas comosus TaxID=4615 RepID=A0A199V7G9_ANACO|nr:uncharacterized protein LOC109723952 isoform X2 [Ananas comosus]OAY73024.1 hypothetical protein ACMD2_02617 [Ananas comosus]
MDPSEPHWRMNSSFSPPLSRRWDCRYQSDGLPNRIHDAPLYGSSISSHSKGSRSGFGSDQYQNHHHSASDGALSYLGSPSDNLQGTRWTPSVRRFDLGEFSTPAGGARPEANVYPRTSERRYTSVNSFGSASPFSESGRWPSSGKHPILFPPRNYSGRRSFMSKPVYPLVFRNPVSEPEASGLPETSNGGRGTPGDDSRASPAWLDHMMSPELKFHKALTELQKMEASPEPNPGSSREGFRWSNASSYDFGYEGDAIEITDHISVESQRWPNNPIRFQKCGLCERLLWQKSPWSSNRIIRNSDMPIAGVLSCKHVFHADCLEETTPKSQIQDPPCPLCLREAKEDGSGSFSEPLQVALRAVRKSQGINITSTSSGGGVSSNMDSTQNEDECKRNHSLQLPPRRRVSLLRSHFRKQFSFKGKMGKDLFGVKVFKKSGASSSSSSSFVQECDQSGPSSSR